MRNKKKSHSAKMRLGIVKRYILAGRHSRGGRDGAQNVSELSRCLVCRIAVHIRSI